MTCVGSCQGCFERAKNQPVGTDYALADDVLVKHWVLPDAGMLVPQHAHAYDHTSFIASGAVRLWVDGSQVGEYRAPTPIFIRAGVKHLFETLKDGTVVLCIHNVRRTGGVVIAEEHHLVEAV